MQFLVKGLILLGFVAMSQAFFKGRPQKFIPMRPMIKKVPYVKKQFVPIVKKVEVRVPAPFPVYVERKVQVPVYIERQVLVNDKGMGGGLGGIGGGISTGIDVSGSDADTINLHVSSATGGFPVDNNNFDNGFNMDNGINIDNNGGFDNGGFNNNGGFDNGAFNNNDGSFGQQGGFIDSGITGDIGGPIVDGTIGGGPQIVHQDVQTHGQTFQHVDAGIGGGKKGGLPTHHQGHF